MHLAVQNGFTYDALFEILPIFLFLQFFFIEFTVFIFQAFFSQKIETNRLKSLFGNRDNLTRTLSDQIVVHRSVKIGFWEIITCRVMWNWVAVNFQSMIWKSIKFMVWFFFDLDYFFYHSLDDQKDDFWSFTAFDERMAMRHSIDDKGMADRAKNFLVQIGRDNSSVLNFLQDHLFFNIDNDSYFAELPFR